ncbi:MAG TPA: cysteine desulfurase family protein [Actinomycetota bacterium]|nr:cysteine desulfurase family protein [Actinomycetota bacterium]
MRYLDHAATTPLRAEVRDAMLPFFVEDFGNPSSVHGFGRRARDAVETGRERVALAIGAAPAEVVFTAGGTEADNLAVKGAAHKMRGNGNHVVVSAFEHHAVLDAVHSLETLGFEVTLVPVGHDGIVDPGSVAAAAARSSTVLVSIMAVNNEIGTIQDVRAVAEAVREVNPRAVVHTDAVQALGKIPVDVHEWGVDLASFAAHKLGGPKGIGALFVRSGVPVEPIIHGGGQERGVRSGTLNVPGIVGFGAAAELAVKEIDGERERLRALRDRLLEGVRECVPGVIVNGTLDSRVAGNLNVCIPGTEGETLLLLLDRAGIACSSGSACSSGALDPSHVLLAIGTPRDLARGSLRFSLGSTTTRDDVDAVLDALPDVVATAQRAA